MVFRFMRYFTGAFFALSLCVGCASGGSTVNVSPDEPQSNAEQAGAKSSSSMGELRLQGVEHSQDTLEKVNRPVFSFNYNLDQAILKPVAKTYSRLTPGWFKRRVSNFFHWLREPGNTTNNLLQGDSTGAMASFWRFLINGTLGLGGLYDPATRLGVEKASTDFDATLARWGMQPGNYIVLPIMGPTDIRDILGLIGDAALSPTLFFEPSGLAVGTTLLNAVDTRASLLPLENAMIGEPYTFVREAYLQSREDEQQQDDSGEAVEDEFDF